MSIFKTDLNIECLFDIAEISVLQTIYFCMKLMVMFRPTSFPLPLKIIGLG